MKPRIHISILGMVAVLLASCAPKAPPLTAQPQINLPQAAAATPTPESVIQPQATNEVPVATAVPTSRGPNLEATDPATVSLASGQLQLVEFFRFT